MTDNISIPLNKLLAWEGNVRKTDADKGIEELAASIAAHGLLQSLVVRKDRRGKYAVVAGRRRLIALELLAKQGSIDGDRPIPCHVIGDETDAAEISLAENVQREAMHPADEFEAFKALVEKGTPVADVAARFGVTETVVQRRLRLARVSPSLIDAYRRDEMTLQHLMAFAVTDDREAQESLWSSLPSWRKDDPGFIHRTLTKNEVTAGDGRVRFIGFAVYEDAGGTVRRDLFSEDEDGVFIDDIPLLERLVAEQLEQTAEAVRAEGWKWVEVRPSFDWDDRRGFEHRLPETLPLSPEMESELNSLIAERDGLADLEDLTDEQQERYDALSERIDELEDGEQAWTPETKAIAGAVVTLDDEGEAEIHRGYVRPEDVVDQCTDEDEACEPEAQSVDGKAAFPASLIEDLTAERSAALSAALLERPELALAATVHLLLAQLFTRDASDSSVLQIRATRQSRDSVEDSKAAHALALATEQWGSRFPSEPGELFAWCLAQDGATLTSLLAFCVGQTVNAVRRKADRVDSRRLRHADHFAEALSLDMADWFTPTAENYFGRISKASILDALREIKGDVAPAWHKMKKGDLAALAERSIVGTRWLPELLRVEAPASDQANAA